jgi:hypothetical protein
MNFKEFWAKYKGDIFKLLTTRLALAVFSIVCLSPLLVFDTQGNASSVKTLLILFTILVFVFYYYLIHSHLWTLGAKNKISADGGRMKLIPLAGLYMGLIAAAPSIILNIVNIFTYFYRYYPGYKSVHTITAVLELLWDAPSIGLFYVTGTPIAYVAASLLPALFAGISYYLGTKEIRLFKTNKNEN